MKIPLKDRHLSSGKKIPDLAVFHCFYNTEVRMETSFQPEMTTSRKTWV
jgi:hypothetical protein